MRGKYMCPDCQTLIWAYRTATVHDKIGQSEFSGPAFFCAHKPKKGWPTDCTGSHKAVGT